MKVVVFIVIYLFACGVSYVAGWVSGSKDGYMRGRNDEKFELYRLMKIGRDIL